MAAAVLHGPSQLLESGQTAENLKSAKCRRLRDRLSDTRYGPTAHLRYLTPTASLVSSKNLS
jgi:hypothetical protein